MSLFLQRGGVGVRGFLTLLTDAAAGPPAALTEPDCASEDAEEARTRSPSIPLSPLDRT